MGWLDRIAEEEARQRRMEVEGTLSILHGLRWLPRLWLAFMVFYVVAEVVG